MADDDGKDYEVGYGKPPVHSRFKKGQPGNRHGRPRKKPVGEIDIGAILEEQVEFKINGKPQTGPVFEVNQRQLATRAMGGDMNAAKRFMKSCEEHRVIAPSKPDPGGGVVTVPKGISCQEWVNEQNRLRLAKQSRQTKRTEDD